MIGFILDDRLEDICASLTREVLAFSLPFLVLSSSLM
jgi:hypothetical protein